jgi:hypothetical protein
VRHLIEMRVDVLGQAIEFLPFLAELGPAVRRGKSSPVQKATRGRASATKQKRAAPKRTMARKATAETPNAAPVATADKSLIETPAAGLAATPDLRMAETRLRHRLRVRRRTLQQPKLPPRRNKEAKPLLSVRAVSVPMGVATAVHLVWRGLPPCA